MWICLREKELEVLLEEIEDCSHEKGNRRFQSSWTEDGSYISVEGKRNRVVWDVEGKMHVIAIPEGKHWAEGGG